MAWWGYFVTFFAIVGLGNGLLPHSTKPLPELKLTVKVIIPPVTKLGGYIGFTLSVRLSVCLSVRLSVCLSVRLSVCLSVCLVHPGVRDKCRVSEIDLSQPRHETAFWWRHNGPVTSQLTHPIKWRNYPFELMFKCAYINTQQRIHDTKISYIDKCTTVFDIFVHIHMVWVLMDKMHYFASQITVTASP